MKNIKDKKTEAYLDNLILSLTKNKINESIRKENEFKLGALFIYLLMIKVNTKKRIIILKRNYQKKVSVYIWQNKLRNSECYIYTIKKINTHEWKKEKKQG